MIFLNQQNEVRSGWKFLIYLVFFLIILLVTEVALSFLVGRGDNLTDNQIGLLALNEIALFVPAVVAMLLTIRLVDHRPLQTFGVGFLPGWPRQFCLGIGLSAAMLAVLLAGSKAVGVVTIRWTGGRFPAITILSTFSLLLLAALNEELVFRGFPLQILTEGMGKWPGMVVMSALFGAVHLGNPNSSILGTLNTVLAGILLSLAYVRTRSLWLPYAIHMGWNVGLGFVLGFALSGLEIASLWTTGVSGSHTILGGNYGPEGGLLATFIFAASAAVVYRYGSINPNQAHSSSDPRRHHRD